MADPTPEEVLKEAQKLTATAIEVSNAKIQATQKNVDEAVKAAEVAVQDATK